LISVVAGVCANPTTKRSAVSNPPCVLKVSAAALQIAEEPAASGLAWHFEKIRDVSESRPQVAVGSKKTPFLVAFGSCSLIPRKILGTSWNNQLQPQSISQQSISISRVRMPNKPQ
jgi:hypothetical protein